LLRRLTAIGHGDTPVRRADRPDTTAAELAGELETFALDLAARFDARNGTGHQSDVIRSAMSAEPYGVQVPLSPTDRRAVTPTTEPVTAPAPRDQPLPEIDGTATAAELIDLAEQYFRDDRADALQAVLTAYDARFTEPEDPALAARLWSLRGFVLPVDATEETTAAWERSAELFAAAGNTARSSAIRARLTLYLAQDDEVTPAVLAEIEADVTVQEERGDPESRAAALLRLAQAYRMMGRLDEANEAGDRSDRAAAEDGDPRRVAHHAMVRAQTRAMAGRTDEALMAARSALEFYAEHGPDREHAEAAMVLGQITDDPSEIVAALGVPLAFGLEGAALPARIKRGRALLHLGRAEESIADFVEAVAICAESRSEEHGLFARQELAQAYYQADRPAEAAEVAEEALLGFERLGHEEPADNTRFLLAAVYRDLGDNDRALTIYRDLIEKQVDNPAGRGQIAEQAGQLLYDLDRDSEAALTFLAAAEALREAGDPAGELRVLRRRLMALNYADEVPEAEEVIKSVAQRYAELPAELAESPGVIWGKAIFAFEAGHMLMRRGRYAEALTHLYGAPDILRGIGATDDADRVDSSIGEALLRSGSPVEAERVLGALLERMSPDLPIRQMVVQLHEEATKGLNDR
jgi:tetratricopeptide (TPR) repeat protein